MDISDINFRVLEDEEFDREELVKMFSKNNGVVPDPNLSKIIVAEYNDRIIGFYTLQPILHAEPMLIEEEFRKLPIHKQLMSKMLELLNGTRLNVYLFAPDKKIKNFAIRSGFSTLNYEVLHQQF